MKKLSKLLVLPLVLVACGSGLSISVYRGNHEKQRIERRVQDPKTGRVGWQYVNADDPRFSQFQAVHDSNMEKIYKAVEKCRKAGVKLDDL